MEFNDSTLVSWVSFNRLQAWSERTFFDPISNFDVSSLFQDEYVQRQVHLLDLVLWFSRNSEKQRK